MPILAAHPPVTPTIVHPTEAPDLTWTSAGGVVTPLNDWFGEESGLLTMPGVLNLLMPSYTFAEDESPSFDGTSVRNVRARARDISVPVHLWGVTRDACRTRLARLVADLNPQLGPGVLTLTEPDGTSRSIDAYYSSGMEGASDDHTDGVRYMTAVLVFHAPRPFWEGDAVVLNFSIPPTGNFYPILPVTVGDSQVLGSLTVENTGNVAAFPQWTIHGPGDLITLENTTTGESIVIDHTLTDTDVVTIDTRDGQKTVLLNGSTNLWGDVGLDSVLWALQPGTNELSLEVTGADTDTAVEMTYRQRWLTAY